MHHAKYVDRVSTEEHLELALTWAAERSPVLLVAYDDRESSPTRCVLQWSASRAMAPMNRHARLASMRASHWPLRKMCVRQRCGAVGGQQ